MRRLLGWLLALGLVGMTVGCHHTAGVCDCDIDPEPCIYRAPWYRMAPPGEPLPAPTQAPKNL